MRKRNMSKDRRAVSTVIATVIIVAVTIAIAIAVAYWVGGLATIFTRYEKIEIKSIYVNKAASNYIVTVNFDNTGSSGTSVDSIMLNGVPCASFTPAVVPTASLVAGTVLNTGITYNGTIPIPVGQADPSGNVLGPGVTLTVNIHTTGGKDYYASVALP